MLVGRFSISITPKRTLQAGRAQFFRYANHSATLTKTTFPLAELRLLNAGKWWFGPVDGFDVQMPYRKIRFL
jgi:hypothetical protein